MIHQSKLLYAAIHAAEFPAQSILRMRPDLQAQPIAILDGVAPQERVCSLNLHARKRGAALGMTRLEVEELGGICVFSRSVNTEIAARTVLLECVAQFSPRIEETFASNACEFVLDISGTERLFGLPATFAQRLRTAIKSVGFHASLAISRSFDTARIKAECSRGITVIPNEQEASYLASIPIASLKLDEEYNDKFALWGIRTLDELAELPEEELIARFGQKSQRWLRVSRGEGEHTFQPLEPKFELKEHIEFEAHVEQLDSLLFIGANMINNLISRATSRALSLANLTVRMCLEKRHNYERVIRPAIPSSDRKFLLKLLQLEIAAHPPQAAIITLTMTAEAGQQSKVQLGLFAPQTPEPSRLDVTLARLKALVGAERVGSPVLSDTHRSGSFKMENFVITDHPPTRADSPVRIALRRMRPPRPLCVRVHFAKPVSFVDGVDRYDVQAAFGPWHSNGYWWSVHKWDMEEWDVKATNDMGETVGCLIVYDNLKSKWLLDAFYD